MKGQNEIQNCHYLSTDPLTLSQKRLSNKWTYG